MDRRIPQNGMIPHDENEERRQLAGAAMIIGAYYTMSRNECAPRPLRNEVETSATKVRRLLDGHPSTIFNKIRMTANSFVLLSNLLRRKCLLTPSNNVCIDEKLMITLEILGQGTTNRE